MLSHNVGHQVEKAQYNQTAVMLLIETSRLVRDNTSRAVTSLDNMVLYFMKTKGSENETSLMGILHVSGRQKLLLSSLILSPIILFSLSCYSWANYTNRYVGQRPWHSLPCCCFCALSLSLVSHDVPGVPSSFSVCQVCSASSSVGYWLASIWPPVWQPVTFVCDPMSSCVARWAW